MPNILKFLLPNEKKFFLMLNDQSKNLLEGAKLFFDAINEYNQLDLIKIKERQIKIKEIEKKGDRIAHYIIEQIDKNFITPFDREDIHRLSIMLDDVLDLINTTFRRFVLYNLKEVDEYIIELTRHAFNSVNEVNYAVHDLKKLKNVKIHCARINILEHEADNVLGKSVNRLFKEVKDPIILFKKKEIYEYMEKINDKCKDVSNLLQSIVVKHG